MPVTLTALPVPTFLSAKLPVPVKLTVSPDSTPALASATASAVLPS